MLLGGVASAATATACLAPLKWSTCTLLGFFNGYHDDGPMPAQGVKDEIKLQLWHMQVVNDYKTALPAHSENGIA